MYIIVLANLEYTQTKLLGGVAMKRGKYFAVLLMLSLLVACAPMDHRISVQDIETRHITQNGNDFDHDALAKEYEDLARDIQAKAQEQKEIYKQKSHYSHFGKHRKSAIFRITNKIRRYEKTAQESLDKAAYHRQISANINQAVKKNKARKDSSNNNSPL